MMGRRIGVAVATLGLVVPAGLALGTTGAEAKAKYYSSCDNLHKDYKHGVAKSKKAANKQVNQGYGRPAYGKTAKAVYWKNHGRLDRDDDGTACEA